jgi:hypothetical protein
MLTRHAAFTGDTASDRFDVCWVAIHLGRTVGLNKSQGTQSRDERRRDVAILKALKACSGPAPDAPALDGGEAQRAVTPGAILVLEQPQHDRLCALIDLVPWMTAKIEAVEATLDWLAAADKLDT